MKEFVNCVNASVIAAEVGDVKLGSEDENGFGGPLVVVVVVVGVVVVEVDVLPLIAPEMASTILVRPLDMDEVVLLPIVVPIGGVRVGVVVRPPRGLVIGKVGVEIEGAGADRLGADRPGRVGI